MEADERLIQFQDLVDLDFKFLGTYIGETDTYRIASILYTVKGQVFKIEPDGSLILICNHCFTVWKIKSILEDNVIEIKGLVAIDIKKRKQL